MYGHPCVVLEGLGVAAGNDAMTGVGVNVTDGVREAIADGEEDVVSADGLGEGDGEVAQEAIASPHRSRMAADRSMPCPFKRLFRR